MDTKYVLKGLWEDKMVYYVKELDKTWFGLPVRQLSETIDEAKIFDSIEDVEEAVKQLHDPILKIFPVCPICHKDYDGYPAISRRDNKSKICSNCGINEALSDFVNYSKKNKATN